MCPVRRAAQQRASKTSDILRPPAARARHAQTVSPVPRPSAHAFTNLHGLRDEALPPKPTQSRSEEMPVYSSQRWLRRSRDRSGEALQTSAGIVSITAGAGPRSASSRAGVRAFLSQSSLMVASSLPRSSSALCEANRRSTADVNNHRD